MEFVCFVLVNVSVTLLKYEIFSVLCKCAKFIPKTVGKSNSKPFDSFVKY
jgi:hypothetical protein